MVWAYLLVFIPFSILWLAVGLSILVAEIIRDHGMPQWKVHLLYFNVTPSRSEWTEPKPRY